MATTLDLDAHLKALDRAASELSTHAAAAGPHAGVPTCPGWTVTDLVVHQGMVHRWAVAELGDEAGQDPEPYAEQGRTAPDLLAWFGEGVRLLRDAIEATPPDAEALVFLRNAPPPRRFWARRQAHETTIHAVDALSGRLGRWPRADDVAIDPEFAADGIDELLTGFLPRRRSRLRSARPYVVSVQTTDLPAAWTIQVSSEPPVSQPGIAAEPDAVIRGTAVQLYLALWNRIDDLPVSGRPGLAEQWRTDVRVSWN